MRNWHFFEKDQLYPFQPDTTLVAQQLLVEAQLQLFSAVMHSFGTCHIS